MTMYHLMHGVNAATLWILPMLGKHPDEYPRFRDCFVHDAKKRLINVYTRTGGGNRDHDDGYGKENDELTKSPYYVQDFDDDFDCTYANFIFHCPEEWVSDFDRVLSGEDISDLYFEKVCKVFPKLEEKLRLSRNEKEGSAK